MRVGRKRLQLLRRVAISHAINLRLGRKVMQVLHEVAQLAGVPVDTVAGVILAQAVMVELAKIAAARKVP